ncbi:hypothetical protein [Pelagicoccus sp. SDUM812003]|uniref:hypothetical protein n=1 Tax=Pelagicoccus sp. SDUM812003 TaxID=3041267 RepID=UPI00280F0F7B|nr:hypothetical protein [Pelagicoccus sp. SDUM812003]MDQ8204364.1 hypothetical protein [Pelagicoccus sp. SDUM812003]
MTHRNRRQFLATTIALSAATAFPLAAQNADTSPPKRPPALPLELIKPFVVAAHKSLQETRALLSEHPELINATWDWGGGDYETALGGAAHMGHRDIALYLLEKGARIDLFAAAMLGMTDFVGAALRSNPEFLKTPGPHGIPLIAHAEKGGEPAADTLAYLKRLTSD